MTLSIHIPAAAGYAVGFALAMNFIAIAIAIRQVWPVLSDKAARRVARMQRAKAASKK